MKKIVTFILLVLVCIFGYAQTIDPVLLEEMGQRRDNEKIKVFVIMRQQYDQQQLNRRASHFTTRDARREFVVNELKQFAEATQYDLRHSLAEMQRNDLVSQPKTLWIANAIYFEATRNAILSLADRSDIMVIGFDEERNWIPDGEEPQPADPTREITSNVTQVNANQVWSLGYTGQGVVVAVIDTGVNYNHLDLADHLWDGGLEFPHHGYDVYNNDNDPMDDHSHGTHCAGTVCGDGTAGSQTGMAPDATLMCVKCLSSAGRGSDTDVINGMQWAVDHGCDVISMSLGGHGHSGAQQTMSRNACVNVLTAGIIASISAGNEGDELSQYPIPDNIGLPGGCPPPYLDPEQEQNPGGLSCSVCVGAVDSNDQAAYFTSQGPRDWSNSDYADYPYTSGSLTEFGLIRPDVCAPGVYIKSADYGSNTGYSTKSGTSMAAPCVAGCMVLMLSKNIDATPADVCRILEETAVSLSTGKSNIYGYGRVDVLAAVNAMYSGPLTLNSFTVNDGQGNNDGKLNAGESVTLNLSLTNDSDVALDGATMVLTTESEYVTITNGTANLPHFGAGQTQTINNMFAFTLSNDAPAKRLIQFRAETFVNGESVGVVRIGIMVYGHILAFVEVTVLNDNNGNGLLDAGETANLHVTVCNVGNEQATSVVGTLATTYPYLVINSNNKSFGTIDVNGQASADFNVSLSGSAPESYTIDLSLDLVDASQKHTVVDFELWKKAITLTSNPAEGGTLSGAGYYGQGQTCTITATANPGYAFVRWTLNGSTVSYLSSYTFEITGEAEYVAHFQTVIDGVVVGDGEGRNSYLPTSVFNQYTLSQQIYTADELNLEACDITGVSFFNTTISFTRDLTVYMVNTSKTAFGSNTDWIPVTEDDQVYSGSYTFSGNSWTTIYFDTVFVYDGSSNIALIVDDNSGSMYLYSMPCRVSSTESCQALCAYNLFTNYDPLSPNYNGNQYMEKNQVIFGVANYDYTVTASANPTNGGTVSGGGGPYYYGYPITLTATPNEGYVFNNWTKNGEVVSCLSPYSFSVSETAEYVANFQQMDGIVIGEASNTSTYLPTYYYYSLTEQIYTADEMGGAPCQISSVSFYNTGTSSRTRSMSVYMVSTDKTSFDSISDWIPVSESNLMFSGSVVIPARDWATIYFSTPFSYDGSSNVALIVDDNTNSYNSYTSCRTFNTEGSQAIRIYGSDTNYDPYNPTDYSGTLMSMKNQVVFGIPSYDYTINATANPSNGGTVSGDTGSHYYGQNCTLVATANEGYCFYNWTENGTVVSSDATYTFAVTDNRDLVANFGEPISITVSANPAECGTVSGGGSFGLGATVTINASANEGYAFYRWTLNGSAVSYLSTYTFSVSTEAEYVAEFVEVSNGVSIGDPTTSNVYLPSYSLYNYSLTQQIYTADEIGMPCEISSITFFNTGSLRTRSYTIYMKHTSKSSFTNSNDWISVTNADEVFSGSVTMVVNDWTTITFDTPFVYDGTSNLALIVDDNTGSWSSTMSCRVMNADGNQSIRIYSDGMDYDPFNPSQYNGALLTVKNQIILGFTCNITANANPSQGGTISGSGNYAYGATCTLAATPNAGYYFLNWTENGAVVSYDNVYSFVANNDRNLTANFMEGESSCSIVFDLQSSWGSGWYGNYLVVDYGNGNTEQLTLSSGSSISYSREVATGSTIALSWIAGSYTYQCSFDVKFENGVPIYHSSGLGSGFQQELNINCAVATAPHVITAVADPEEGGTIEGAGTYDGGTEVTLTATPNDGYSFCFWSENGQQVSTNASYSFIVTSDRDLVARFSLPLTVSVTTNMASGGTVTGGGVYNYGNTCTLTATPNEGYLFLNWNKNGEVVSCDATYSFAVTEDVDLEAVFMLLEGTLIGQGEATNQYLPSYSFYKYSLSQQIYTPEEIGEAGTITSISYFNAGGSKTRSYDIYMVHTDKSTFDNITDWITVSEADLVYSGSVTMTQGYWTTITLDSPFEYNGSSNLVIAIDDNSGSYTGSPHMACRVFNTNGSQAIRVYSDDTNYDPNAPSGYNGTRYWVKNQIIIGMETEVEQVIALANGFNWISFNVDITLDDLKAALVAAMPGATSIKIQSKDNSVTYNGSRWRGQLTTLSVEQMYKIETQVECEITLEGMPLNPVDHPITINAGSTWIGFPFAADMSLTDAFAGFAVSGDKISAKGQSASYNGTHWRGPLDTLVPGQGYVFESATDRTFVYPTGSSKAAPVPNK